MIVYSSIFIFFLFTYVLIIYMLIFWHIKGVGILYLRKVSLMKFQVFSGFISFLILEIDIKCPEEIFKKLLNVTIYLYDNYLECFS